MSNSKKQFLISDLWDSGISEFENVPAFNSDEISRALAEHRENAARERAAALVQMMGTMKCKNGDLLRNLKEIREKEKKARANLARYTRAFEYFMQTGNPFPFAALMDNLSEEFLNKVSDSDRGLIDRGTIQYWCQNLGIKVADLPTSAFLVPQDFSPKNK